MTDTIAALSSGAPPAAIAVIRLSGPKAFDTSRRLAGTLPPDRQARVRRLTADDDLLDHALVIAFPAPATATGEDMVEFHVHGGEAVVDAVLTALTSAPGVRLAEPGEFTRRALQHGRLDLTQVEGLGALLAAETEAQRRAAVHAAGGALYRAIAQIEAQLLAASARVELMLDFADEDDGANETATRLALDTLLGDLAASLQGWIAAPAVDSLLRGFRVVLAGPPNSGKSTLLNRMSGRDAAIVSDVAGTTRDRIDVAVQHDGIAFVLTDTAGLNHQSDDPIEQIGIGRAQRAIDDADILVWLGDGPSPRHDAILVHSRADMPGREPARAGRTPVSGLSGDGVGLLWKTVADRARLSLPASGERSLNQRQRGLMGEVAAAIDSALSADDLIVVGHFLAQARTAIHRLTGRSDTESMLDALFGRFCIGK